MSWKIHFGLAVPGRVVIVPGVEGAVRKILRNVVDDLSSS